MSDLISQIRFALRNALLSEEVHKQYSIFFTVIPGAKPKWASAPSETHIRIFGLDRAMARSATGFGSKEEGSEDIGSWQAVGLPAQTATGLKDPPPWVLFMDWFWNLLKTKGLNPNPHEGFGDSTIPYNQLRPYQKRQRKYGVMHKPEMAPGEQLPSALKAASAGGTANWPRGYDIKKDVTIIIDSLGTNQDEVSRKFNEILLSIPTPPWMAIIPDVEDHRWFISFDYETADNASEYADRQKSIDVYKAENREKWIGAIRKLAAGKTNPAQLAPLIRRWLVAKHQFPRPFHVDMLSQEDFNRAIETIGNATLEELVAFAKQEGIIPPIVGAGKQSSREKLLDIMTKRWGQIVNNLAEQGGVEPALIEVALSEYLTKYRCGKCPECKRGDENCEYKFDDPFEYDMAHPAAQSRAIDIVGSLTFDDIRGLLESVQKQVRFLTEGQLDS